MTCLSTMAQARTNTASSPWPTRCAAFLDNCGPTQHLIGSILIDIDADIAVSRAYVQARHQRIDNPAGPVFDSNGEYIDRWQRRAEGWRIIRRDARWANHSGDPGVLQAGLGDLG